MPVITFISHLLPVNCCSCWILLCCDDNYRPLLKLQEIKRQRLKPTNSGNGLATTSAPVPRPSHHQPTVVGLIHKTKQKKKPLNTFHFLWPQVYSARGGVRRDIHTSDREEGTKKTQDKISHKNLHKIFLWL